jgi:hypothetical protein
MTPPSSADALVFTKALNAFESGEEQYDDYDNLYLPPSPPS